MEVAPATGRHNVLPGMRTVLTSWNYMVKGQIMGFFSAVLASELVPQKNFFLGKLAGQKWPLNHVGESDNRGSIYQPGNCVELASVIF